MWTPWVIYVNVITLQSYVIYSLVHINLRVTREPKLNGTATFPYGNSRRVLSSCQVSSIVDKSLGNSKLAKSFHYEVIPCSKPVE